MKFVTVISLYFWVLSARATYAWSISAKIRNRRNHAYFGNSTTRTTATSANAELSASIEELKALMSTLTDTVSQQGQLIATQSRQIQQLNQRLDARPQPPPPVARASGALNLVTQRVNDAARQCNGSQSSDHYRAYIGQINSMLALWTLLQYYGEVLRRDDTPRAAMEDLVVFRNRGLQSVTVLVQTYLVNYKLTVPTAELLETTYTNLPMTRKTLNGQRLPQSNGLPPPPSLSTQPITQADIARLVQVEMQKQNSLGQMNSNPYIGRTAMVTTPQSQYLDNSPMGSSSRRTKEQCLATVDGFLKGNTNKGFSLQILRKAFDHTEASNLKDRGQFVRALQSLATRLYESRGNIAEARSFKLQREIQSTIELFCRLRQDDHLVNAVQVWSRRFQDTGVIDNDDFRSYANSVLITKSHSSSYKPYNSPTPSYLCYLCGTRGHTQKQCPYQGQQLPTHLLCSGYNDGTCKLSQAKCSKRHYCNRESCRRADCKHAAFECPRV